MRAPEEQDFKRFRIYSRYVVRLGWDYSPREPLTGERLHNPEWSSQPRCFLHTSHHIPSATWDFLSTHAPRPLLPNLQSLFHEEQVGRGNLAWRDIPFHPADLHLGPRLRNWKVLCIDTYQAPERANELVRSLSGVAGTSMEHISIEALPEYGVSYFAETGLLDGPEIGLFSRLTSFNSRTVRVAPDALLALGRLPCLESLLLHVNPDEYSWEMLPHGQNAVLFPALLQLTLYKINFEWSTAFLNMLTSPSLHALSIRSQKYPLPPPIVFHALCAAIGRLPSANSITDIFITIGGLMFDNFICDGHEIYWSEDIAPLLALRTALRRLIITGQCITVVNDFALAAMSWNWPHIVELVLTWTWNVDVQPQEERWPEDDDFPYATAWGLLQLAQRCPRMTKLALAVDLRFAPPPDHFDAQRERAMIPGVPLSGDAVSALVEFDAKGSLLGDTVCVASFLSLIFPRLQTIWPSEPGWWEMQKLYEWLVRVRAQERAFGQRSGRQSRSPDVLV